MYYLIWDGYGLSVENREEYIGSLYENELNPYFEVIDRSKNEQHLIDKMRYLEKQRG